MSHLYCSYRLNQRDEPIITTVVMLFSIISLVADMAIFFHLVYLWCCTSVNVGQAHTHFLAALTVFDATERFGYGLVDYNSANMCFPQAFFKTTGLIGLSIVPVLIEITLLAAIHRITGKYNARICNRWFQKFLQGKTFNIRDVLYIWLISAAVTMCALILDHILPTSNVFKWHPLGEHCWIVEPQSIYS